VTTGAAGKSLVSITALAESNPARAVGAQPYNPQRLALSSGTRLGPYEILSPLGAGGMGEVYKARDTRLNRVVAVKVLPSSFVADEERLRRFTLEAQAAGALNHPNVLVVHDVGADNGVSYVVSELLEGQTLREALSGGALPARKAVDYAVQTANGLAAAHDHGIVHRDLKPENLFVTRDGRLKILDFGLAKLAGGEAGAGHSLIPTLDAGGTTPGVLLGTVGYMSPEQLRGESVDARSDIFSLGAVIYEMFSGARAFQGKTAVETMSAILREDPPEMVTTTGGAAPAVERIVRRCLEKNRDERFQSARDLSFALEAVSTASGSAARPVLEVARLSSTRRRAMLSAGALVLIAIGALAGRGLRSAPVGTPPPEITQLTFENGLVESARFAPDGQSIVYAAAWEGRDQELFSVRADRPESHPMGLTKANVLSISGNGQMALALGITRNGAFSVVGTLARTPLVGGTPREMLENVEAADWASDGNRIAVIRRQNNVLLSVEWPAGHVVYSARNWISHLRISPNGQLLAFADHPVGGDDGTLVVLDQSGKQKLSVAGWASIQGVAWSPDGREVWFTATKSGGMRALYGVTLAGRERVLYRSPITLTLQDVARDGRVLLTAGDPRLEVHGVLAGSDAPRPLSTFDFATQPSLSDDGTVVVYGESGEGSVTYGVYLRRAASGAPVRLGDGWFPSLSHDGKWVSALSRENDALWVLPVGAGEARRLERGPISSYFGFAEWLPDSKRMVFTAREKGSTERHSYVQAINGPPKQLRRVMGRPSPDGTRCLCRDAEKFGVCRLDSDAFEWIPNADDLTPAGWTADGKAFYAYVRTPKTFDVYRVDPATGIRTPFRTVTPGDQTGLISVSFLAMSPTGNAFVYTVARTRSQLYVLRGLR
jgi:eukaryotic-like serine/threonine-protein kinase